MKIENSSKPAAGIVKPATGAPASKVGVASGDDVQLSPLATQLRGSDETAPFDAARVAEIKQAIADGKFQINTGLIADRLLASAKELVASRQG